MSPAHLHDLLPGYVLGDLEPQDLAQVAAHLPGCAACRTEVARLREALFSLAGDLPAAEAPPGSWERLQARRGAVRPLSPQPLRWAWLAAAAAVVLLAVGGDAGWRALNPSAQASAKRWEAQGATRLTLSHGGEPFGDLLVRPDGQALVVLRRPAPAGQVYQVWGRRTDGPRASAPLSLGVTGGTVLQVVWTGLDSVGVSLEPPGGSPAPTHPLGRATLPKI